MKKIVYILFVLGIMVPALHAQTSMEEQAIHHLIAQYAQARETKDTVLLKNILMEDIDQLVSSGVWRKGLETSLKGMAQSSTRNPGSRSLTVKNIRFLHETVALVDCRYTIQRSDGSARKMWSSFLVQKEATHWKIAAIRNMLPAGAPK